MSWSVAMDYLKPPEVVAALIDAGTRKAALPVRDLLLRGPQFTAHADEGAALASAIDARRHCK
jgi:hypothetical protein